MKASGEVDNTEALAFIEAVRASMRYIHLTNGGELKDGLKDPYLHFDVIKKYLSGELKEEIRSMMENEKGGKRET